MLTILHISDLHRDPDHPLSNSALLDSLERDREHYCPDIPNPNLIIVSGDLVHGVKPEAVNPAEKLERQYSEAEGFLSQLAEALVDGDRNRIVIVPGNHDISYARSKESMRPLSIEDLNSEAKKHLVRQMFSENTKMRWSWDELCFYEIENDEVYRARLEAFATFYQRFYQDERSYSLDPALQFEIFDYPDLNLTVVGFNSCYNNDPLNRQGIVHPDCLSEAARTIRKGQYSGRLLFAVWHHNTSGAPMQTDYLDPQTLQVLIDDGFSVGFHGHQHRTQLIDERFAFGENRKITVISAGSLCAGPTGLPTGYRRSYNILEVDTEARTAKLHVRQMVNDFLSGPIWGPGHTAITSRGDIDFNLQAPPERVPEELSASNIGQAEQLIRAKDFDRAASLLQPLSSNNLLARRLLLECYAESGKHEAIGNEFFPPQSVTEIIYIADALWAERNLAKLRELLSIDLVSESVDPAVMEIRLRYEERLKR